MLDEVLTLLRTTYTGSSQFSQTENQLKAFRENIPGYFQVLLRIISKESCLVVQKGAAIQLRFLLEETLCVQDKLCMSESICQVLLTQNLAKRIKSELSCSLKPILSEPSVLSHVFEVTKKVLKERSSFQSSFLLLHAIFEAASTEELQGAVICELLEAGKVCWAQGNLDLLEDWSCFLESITCKPRHFSEYSELFSSILSSSTTPRIQVNLLRTLNRLFASGTLSETVAAVVELYIEALILVFENKKEPWSSFMIIEVLHLLEQACRDTRFYQTFSQKANSLVVKVCMSCLEEDNSLFKEDPQEFVSKSLDIVETKDSKTLQTSASALLESLCEVVYGCLTQTVYFCCEVLDSVLSQSQAHYQVLSYWKESCILKSPQKNQIDTALLVLCCLSSKIANRADLLETIQKLLLKHKPSIDSISDGIIQSRFCLLVHCYCKYLENEAFGVWLDYTTMHMDSVVYEQAVCIQASETFIYLLEEDELMFRIEPFVDRILSNLVKFIANQHEKTFFAVLDNLVEVYTEYLSKHLWGLLNALVQKIHSLRLEKDTLIVTKCWSIINSLADSRVISYNVEEFEHTLVPLFSYLENPKFISFEENIVSVLSSLMKSTQVVSEVQWRILEYLPLIQSKQKGLLGGLFGLLNLYIKFGKEFIQNKLGLIVEMSRISLFAKLNDYYYEVSNSEGAVLFQVLLCNFPKQLNGFIEQILSQTVLRYNSGVQSSFLRVKLLGVVLTALAYETTSFEILSRTKVQEVTYLKFLLCEIAQNSFDFVYSYDKRLAVLGICRVLCAPSNETWSILGLLLEVVIQILTNASPPEKNLDLSQISLPQFDEFEYFKKQVNQNIPKEVVLGISQKSKEQLLEVLKTIRVPIDSLQNTLPRKIVKPKFKNN